MAEFRNGGGEVACMGNIFARREELLKEAEEVYREIFRESILCLEESYHTEGYKKSVTEALLA